MAAGRPPWILCWFLGACPLGTSSLFLQSACKRVPSTTDVEHPSRRHAIAALAGASSLMTSSLPSVAAPLIPDPQALTTVVLDSADMRIGVELFDVTIGSSPVQIFPAVRAVSPSGVAASAKVEAGMIVLGNYQNTREASKSVVNRIRAGPYPIVLQFYNLGGESDDHPMKSLVGAQQASKEAASVKEPPLSFKGTGLKVKTVQKPSLPCPNKVRRGDILEIIYEARVASSGGPIYDSSKERGSSVSFEVGAGEVVNGVDIGVNYMCPGEIREMDIPAALGYGRAGSEIFDIPGDVRLWWRVELLKVTKDGPKAAFLNLKPIQ